MLYNDPDPTFVPFRNAGSQHSPVTPTPKTTPIKHLSETEMRAHREKGLCYNCDEKWSRGHRCVQQKLYLLDVDSPPLNRKNMKMLKKQ